VPIQVAQYVRTYLGNSSDTMTFVQQYLQKREIWRQQNKMLQVTLLTAQLSVESLFSFKTETVATDDDKCLSRCWLYSLL